MDFRYVEQYGTDYVEAIRACISASPFSDSDEYVVFPGFCDVHVHFREPGFSYKETIASGCRAAARGGYTAVCPMPNLNPVPDSREHLDEELAIIRRDACIDVRPYAAITVGEKGRELVDMASMPEAVAFSDDGKGVQDEAMMRAAMERAKSLDRMIVAHCEVDSLLNGGYIHDGAYAKAHGHRGISSESEWREVERDLRLSEETGCAFHVCHVSTKESLDLVRKARARGVDASCETAPHYLVLDESDLKEDGWFKMNPPLRGKEDREALIEGLRDGTVECIATDHAPHAAEEKSRGLEKSAFGVVGLETAFPILYTELVKKGAVELETILALLTDRPRARFRIPLGTDFSVWDLNAEYTIDPRDFATMGRATPFAGRRVYGKCLATWYSAKRVF